MKKRILTLLAVLAILVGALSIVGMAAESTVETLSADQSDYTVSSDMTLDLAGNNITNLVVEAGVKLVLTDSVGDGEITNITGGGIVELADGYMNFAGGNKLTLTTAGIGLPTDGLEEKGASLYYKSQFSGNATVKEKISAYGVAMYVGSAKNLFAEKTYTEDDASTWTTSGAFYGNSVQLAGILKADNVYSVNKVNAKKKINSVPYVTLADGETRITGATATRTLQQVVEGVVTEETNAVTGSVIWDTLSYNQKSYVVDLYNTFESFMSSWDMGRVDPLVKEAADQTYYIYDKFDAEQISTVTGADIQLMTSIDLEGVTIDGLTNFTGSFYGNGYTLSNFTVNGIGLVDQVASGETVSNLHLRDVNVVVSADATATAVGLIAGTNNGTVSGVSATGSVKDTRENVIMGALVGNNAGTVSATANITVTNTVNTLKTDGTGVGENNTSYTTTGLVASVGLYNDAEGVTRGIVGGGNAIANADTVYWRDSSYSTERQAQVLQNRRQTAVDYVYQSGTIKWTVPSTMTYYADQANYSATEKPSGFAGIFGGSFHIHNQKFVAGTTYVGIPYTHCSSSLEQVKYYTTQNSSGIYVVNSDIATIVGGNEKSGNFLTGYTYSQNAGDADWASGNIGWAKYIGSDCSSALTMGWHKVSQILTSSKSNGGVCLFYTTNIVPSEYNQWYYGIRQVGDYVVDDEAMSDGNPLTTTVDGVTTNLTYTVNGVTKNQYNVTTDAIVNEIGADAVYEAYAQTQMGDILNSSGTAGHSRMAAIDPVVIRNGNGVIDPAKSYFVTHEQGDGLYERATTNSSWRINYQYTFEQLAYQNTDDLTGSSGYYLPVSMDAFHDASLADTGTVTLSGGRTYTYTKDNVTYEDPSYVVLNSYFRIQSATMTIKDANGNVKYQKTAFQGASSSQNRRRAVPGNIVMYMNEFFSDYGTNLTAGETYYFTLSGTTFTDETTNVYTDQAFVYTPAA